MVGVSGKEVHGGGLGQGTEVRVRGWQLPAARPHLVSPAGRVASFSMPGSSSRYSLGPSLGRGHEVGERVQSNEMGMSVLIMQPILRFLQLLCENHNRDLQVSASPAPAPPLCPASPWALLPGCALWLVPVIWLGTMLCGGSSPAPAAHRTMVLRGPPQLLEPRHAQPICVLQNFLRCQNNKTNYNLVCETLQFLDIMCGSTTGGLGLLGLYINEDNVGLVIQTLETLTEYCQGPCHENQVSCPGRVGGSWGGR